MTIRKRRDRVNRLLRNLPAPERRRIDAISEQVTLTVSEILYLPGAVVRYVYFPTDGYISLVSPIEGATGLEVGIVGDEGMAGIGIALGAATQSLHVLVQGAGTAWRMQSGPFARVLNASPSLQRTLDRYAHLLLGQFALNAACNRFHVVDARLARWLLMTGDRAHRADFFATHEFLAYILGVRRAGVTKAARALHGRNLIRYTRGEISIIDRRGLEAASCSCYLTTRASYGEIMGRRRT